MLYYLVTKRRLQFMLIIVAVLATVMYLLKVDPNNKFWVSSLDPFIGLSTFLVAILLWWNGLRLERINYLPKKLTVRFMFDQQLVMICKEAHLVGETDVRAWGLQIGRNMNLGRNLTLEPFLEVVAGNPRLDNRGKSFKPYYLQFYLTDLPSEWSYQDKQRFHSGQYCCWKQDTAGKKQEEWLPRPEVLPLLAESHYL